MVFEGQELTYRELEERSNRLGHHLQQRGVGPEVVVGISLERSLEMIVGVLGILKAGGAYLPLDPGYPAERLSFMLEDAAAPVLLTQRALAGSLPYGGRLLCLDELGEELRGCPATSPRTTATPDNLAYVIYTSGSTGKPKGVMLEHGGVCNLIEGQVQAFALEASRRVLQMASLSFDVSVLEIFSTLCVGATLVLARRESLLPGPELLRLLRKQEITNVTLPPSALAVLPVGKLPTLTTLRVSGEACSAEVLSRWRAGRRIFNSYGPTEGTVSSTYAQYTGPGWYPNIGRPYINKRVHVLDGEMNLVPVGVPGELYLGGVGLARGYLNRPGLTAEGFVPNPYGERGERLYRTGDQCRYLPDGSIEYLGRLDGQVKLRGYRIELGEIEAALQAHPSVRQAVVVAREDAPGDKRLVGYVVPAEGEVSGDILRSHLKQRLPDHMLPSVFVSLDTIPLTPNGKVDRKGLPAPEWRPIQQQYEAPRDATERTVCGIWEEVLQLERVGIHDNFFALGGHSLVGARVMSRVRGAIGLEMPLATLFSHPTVAELAHEIAQWRQAEQDLLVPSLAPRVHVGPLPPSYAQERLWFIEQLEPGSSAYVIAGAVRLTGRLDRRALEATLAEIIRRHEVLRTRFPAEDGVPFQQVQEQLDLPLQVIDLSQLRSSEEEALREQIKEEVTHPFNLERGPLLRLRLVRLGEQEQVLVLALHHSIADGWSIGIVIRELSLLYAAFSRGLPSPLSPLPIQYRDYTLWQREWLQGEVLEGQLAYWREQLADLPALELPTDYPRPPMQTFRGDRVTCLLPPGLVEGVRCLGQEVGATLYMALLAGFSILVSRYAGQGDVAIGSPIAGRTEPELEELIGCFVNTLVLRTDLSGDPTVRELLGRVREVTLGAYAHQDVPFEQVVAALQPERDLARTPLFQVLLVLQNQPMESFELPGLQLSRLGIRRDVAHFDLCIILMEQAEGLTCGAIYSTDLFEGETIERLLGHYQRVLEEMVARPEARISELSLLTEKEEQQIRDWNQIETRDLAAGSVIARFEQQVSRDPGALALRTATEQLSYGELNRRANQLAHTLRGRGVGPDVPVGIATDRSASMVIGVLGILKAGGAYVPLDPSYPAERLAFMLADAGVRLVVGEEGAVRSLPWLDAEVLWLDRDAGVLEAQPETNPAPSAGEEHRAYVIYTSGSTGNPKGVEVPRGGLDNVVAAAGEEIRLEHGEGWLAVAPLSFDMATIDLLLPLAVGGWIELVSQETRRDGMALSRLIDASEVRIVPATPAMWRMLQEAGWQGADRLTAICGGEALTPELARYLAQVSPRVINGYGPTEATIYSTMGDVAPGERITIGRPIANTQTYILDGELRQVPVGIPGELYIGGMQLARGYLKLPGLTAERFIPNPYGERGERLYRTGDQCRYLPDGSIEYLGRLDGQVKLRGYRIELGEIEAALERHPGVRQAVVVAREDTPGDRRLVGYVVPAEGAGVSQEVLRSHLKESLPDYMIPSHLMTLDAIPLTPNGKVDRKGLPAPEQSRDETVAYVPPATTLQHALVGIWEDLLQIEEVGIEDDFFELGGHSLLVARLMARIEAELGVRLPLSMLFEGTRIRDLERAILESGEGRVPGSQVIEVQGGESPTPFFFLHGDLVGGGLYTRGLAEGLGVEEAVQVLAPHGVEGDAVPGSVAEMAAEYCATIREIQPEGPYRLGGFCLGGQVAYELACQLERAGEQVEPLVLIDTPLLAGKRARRVHRVVSWVGERLQLDLDTRRQSFDLVMRVLRDLALLRKLPLRERVQVSLLLLLKSLLLVRGLTRSRRREAGSPRGADGGSGVDRGVLVAHEWAQAGWKPGRYGGRVHLFSVRDGSWQPERLADRWRQVTGEVALHALPGTHVSCLTDDLPHLAAAMRAVLDMHNPASMHCEDQVRELAGPGNR